MVGHHPDSLIISWRIFSIARDGSWPFGPNSAQFMILRQREEYRPMVFPGMFPGIIVALLLVAWRARPQCGNGGSGVFWAQTRKMFRAFRASRKRKAWRRSALQPICTDLHRRFLDEEIANEIQCH